MAVTDPSGVSVIICTFNRLEMLRRALRSVLTQDVSPLEVIVVADSSAPRLELPANVSAQLRVIRAAHQGVGAARAEGLGAAIGTFVAYCDDDDEWEPQHLGTLKAYLFDHPDVALAYGDSRLSRNGESGPVAYSIDYDRELLAQGNYVFASNVMHRADVARDVGGFDRSLQAHEDWDLWLRMSHAHVLRHVPAVIGIRHFHDGCVSSSPHLEEWEKVYRAHQQRLDSEDDTRWRRAKFDRSTWSQDRRELIWCSILREYEGYGTNGRQMLLAVERQGVDVTFPPTMNQPAKGFERFYKPIDRWSKLGFYHHYDFRPSVLRCERVVNLSAWESTVVPESHVDEINRAVALQYVPCHQNLESFVECGVRVPVRVLHHGIEARQFPYLERPERQTFTFGTFGDLAPRKGIDVLIRAFLDEFRRSEPVRLLMKSMSPDYACDDPRVVLITGFLGEAALQEFLREMDVFVLPSRGEGFGKCGLEAMATGLPLIATNWSGPAEYLDPADSYPLSYSLADAKQGAIDYRRNIVYGAYEGQWAEPDYEHLRYLMRWLYEHPEEAELKGKAASMRVHAYWTWDRVARQFCADLTELAAQ